MSTELTELTRKYLQVFPYSLWSAESCYSAVAFSNSYSSDQIFESFYRSLEELKENLDPDSEANKKFKKLLDFKKMDKKRVERLLTDPKVEEVEEVAASPTKKRLLDDDVASSASLLEKELPYSITRSEAYKGDGDMFPHSSLSVSGASIGLLYLFSQLMLASLYCFINREYFIRFKTLDQLLNNRYLKPEITLFYILSILKASERRPSSGLQDFIFLLTSILQNVTAMM
ncbi:17665_t:CDS:2 [Dentiscutata erythropus]|uniref:17665_t:CDS:1 n=1 Tax=Dentiscutata erythropus TaxID=1348616 RepID=A0A9N9C9F4_9GLOM|nr:17665_t:CDS:2 [Dentiscutata erythropus]